MPRHPRIQYPGAFYHVINRGNYRGPVFADSRTAEAFEDCLFEAAEEFGWVILAYVVMRNHFHLVILTPRGNLVAGMHWLETTFCVRFNLLRGENGHVFQGRYKSLVIQPGRWLATVVNYVHLNPVKAYGLSVDRLEQHRASSFRRFTGKVRHPCLECALWMQELGFPDKPAGWEKYRQYLKWLNEKPDDEESQTFNALKRGWAIGNPDWRDEMRQQHREILERNRLQRAEFKDLNRLTWSEALRQLLAAAGKSAEELKTSPKGAGWKAAIAEQMRRKTTATNAWLAEALFMGTANALSVYLSRRRRL